MIILFRKVPVIVTPQGFEVVSTGVHFPDLETMIAYFDKRSL